MNPVKGQERDRRSDGRPVYNYTDYDDASDASDSDYSAEAGDSRYEVVSDRASDAEL